MRAQPAFKPVTKMNKSTVLRVVLSLFLVFHVFALVLAPNSRTYLGSRVGSLVHPYVSFLELASQWGFFAPDPGPPPVFVEYDVIGRGGESIATGTWPEKNDPFFLRERQNRRIAVARFAIAQEKRIEKLMGPYFCGLHPEAASVKLWRVIVNIPNLHDVAAGRRAIRDEKEVNRKWITQFLCRAVR